MRTIIKNFLGGILLEKFSLFPLNIISHQFNIQFINDSLTCFSLFSVLYFNYIVIIEGDINMRSTSLGFTLSYLGTLYFLK